MFLVRGYISFRRILGAAAPSAGLLSVMGGMAHAAPVDVTVSYTPLGLPAASGSVNTIDLTTRLGQTSVTANFGTDTVTINAASGGGIVQGSL